jgi:leucine dehydrogenase
MKPIEQMDKYRHEMVVYGRDEATGLRCIIAVHNTALGPAAGGTRFFNYASEDDALYDVLRLSKGMSLKNATAGLRLGGAKAVIIGDPKKMKSRELFHAYGRVVESLGGKYYTAEDVNININDINYINEVTKYIAGTQAVSGTPSPMTARGVWRGMKAGAKIAFGSDSLKGLRVAVQGLGSVGYKLCRYLKDEGAELTVFDINEDTMKKAVREFGAAAAGPDTILTAECDVFSPCAMGAVFNTGNVPSLCCKMICGAANNVLLDEAAGEMLKDRDILYLPDYVVNAGGIINCGAEVEGWYSPEKVAEKVDAIYDTVLKIIDLAEKEDISTAAAAEKYAWGVIEQGKKACDNEK